MLPLVSSLLSTRVVAVFEAVGDVATERAVGPECRVPTRLGRDARAHAALATLTARGGESRGERTAATFAARRPLRPRDGLRLALSAPGVRGAALRGRRVEHHVLRADAVRLAYAEPALLRARKCGARFPARGAGAPPAVRRARRVRRREGARPTTRAQARACTLRVHRRDEGDAVERAAQCIRTRQGHILEHQSRPRNVRRYEGLDVRCSAQRAGGGGGMPGEQVGRDCREQRRVGA